MDEKIILERLRKEVVQVLPKGGKDVKVDLIKEFGDVMAVQVRYSVLAHRLKTERAKYPADWWQAVKEEFAPQWFLRLWPVTWSIVEIRADQTFPLLQIPHEESFVQISKEEWEETDETG